MGYLLRQSSKTEELGLSIYQRKAIKSIDSRQKTRINCISIKTNAYGGSNENVLPRLSATRIHLFYDRDKAGSEATANAMELLQARDIEVSTFDWGQTFQYKRRRQIPIPEDIQDPCDLSVDQLMWLRDKGLV